MMNNQLSPKFLGNRILKEQIEDFRNNSLNIKEGDYWIVNGITFRVVQILKPNNMTIAEVHHEVPVLR